MTGRVDWPVAPIASRTSPQPALIQVNTVRSMHLRNLHRRSSIAWLALFAILLVALAPTVSQVAMSLQQAGHGAHHAHMQATAAGSDAHAGHAAHPSAGHEVVPDDCWAACGYCDLFSHVPALELPGCGELVEPALPAHAIEFAFDVVAHATHRLSAQPRGPPLRSA